jgi:hypothetical protein
VATDQLYRRDGVALDLGAVDDPAKPATDDQDQND